MIDGRPERRATRATGGWSAGGGRGRCATFSFLAPLAETKAEKTALPERRRHDYDGERVGAETASGRSRLKGRSRRLLVFQQNSSESGRGKTHERGGARDLDGRARAKDRGSTAGLKGRVAVPSPIEGRRGRAAAEPERIPGIPAGFGRKKPFDLGFGDFLSPACLPIRCGAPCFFRCGAPCWKMRCSYLVRGWTRALLGPFLSG
jgi:hypothetical protein